MAASKLMAGPEEAVGELKVLGGLVGDADPQVSRLAMVSLLAVFKDIVPGYRIRPPSEQETVMVGGGDEGGEGGGREGAG